MDLYDIILLAIATVLLASGSLVLVATWFAPRLLGTRFVRWLVNGSRVTADRVNRTLLASLNILLGVHAAAWVVGYRGPGHVALAIGLVAAVVVIRRVLPRAREA